MKKIISTAVFAMLVSLVFAQLKVVAPNGDVGIGTSNPTEKLEVAGLVKNEGQTVEATGASGTTVYERTDGAAVIIGAGITGAGFTFDNSYRFEVRSRGRTPILNRNLSAGALLIRGVGSTGFVGVGGVTAPSTSLHTSGSITYSGSLINASDRNLKKNVKDFKFGLDEILKLRPVTFQYNGKAGIRNNKNHVGLIAQELQKVMPTLVGDFVFEEEDEEGRTVSSETFLNIDESSIKYLLVNSIQEQQEIIEEQEAQIDELNDRLSKLEELVSGLGSNDAVKQTINLKGAKGAMLQNRPNPFNGATTIQYSVNDDAKTATMQIVNMQGQVIKTVDLDLTGNGELVIKENDLPAGSYSYSLLIDGKIVETKQMVLAK